MSPHPVDEDNNSYHRNDSWVYRPRSSRSIATSGRSIASPPDSARSLTALPDPDQQPLPPRQQQPQRVASIDALIAATSTSQRRVESSSVVALADQYEIEAPTSYRIAASSLSPAAAAATAVDVRPVAPAVPNYSGYSVPTTAAAISSRSLPEPIRPKSSNPPARRADSFNKRYNPHQRWIVTPPPSQRLQHQHLLPEQQARGGEMKMVRIMPRGNPPASRGFSPPRRVDPTLYQKYYEEEEDEIYIVRQNVPYCSYMFSFVQVVILALMMWQCGIAPLKIK
jgi:hypothetical protein